MNTISLLVALATWSAFTAAARAEDDNYPEYVRDTWRARLATLAPACGIRDEAWGVRELSGTYFAASLDAPKETILMVTMPIKEARYMIDGAISGAAYVGSKIGALGPAGCKALAEPSAIAMAEATMSKEPPESAAYILPAEMHPVLDEAFAIGEAAACGAISSDREEHVIVALTKDASKFTSGDQEEVIKAVGGVEIADYGGERVGARLKTLVCKSISKNADYRRALSRGLYFDNHPEELWKGTAGPDD